MTTYRAGCRLLALTLAATVLALPSTAQVRKADRLLRPTAPLALPSAPVTRHKVVVSGLHDSGLAVLDEALPQGWALSGFQLNFRNGDHKLRSLGVMPEGRFVRFAFADHNGDDPFEASAEFVGIPGVDVQQVVAEGGGKFEIRLPGSAPANASLVLSGFEFRRSDGTDANLRNIAVVAVTERNSIIVSLTDDQGLDFRALQGSLGATAVSTLVPLPGLMESMTAITSTRALQQAASSGIRRMSGKYRGYRATVQYAWIPNARVAREGAYAGAGYRMPRPASRMDALQGFEFTFNNSDHHLKSIGVRASDYGVNLVFQDNNTDDPIQWSVSYLTLKP